MSYALENALDQWRAGERRFRQEPALDAATRAVTAEVHKRVGVGFEIRELVELYAAGTDWAEEVAQRYAAGEDAVLVVDAAFALHAREAADFAGGKRVVRED